MKSNLVFAALIGLALGIGFSNLPKQPIALGEETQATSKWQYQVIFVSLGTPNEAQMNYINKKFNTLAAEGWEYYGPMADHNRDGDSVVHGEYVVFRRATNPAK